MKKVFQHKYIVSLLFIILFLSCSTEKNTFVNRNYHNMTAHYNVYFNGNEAMKMGLLKIETRFEEDFTKILPINKESLPGTEDMVTSDMNIAIEKGIKLIKLHSISKPPKSNQKKDVRKRKPVKSEYNKWIDDAYMLMGKAYLYQKDYFRASNTFTSIIRKYKKEPVKFIAYLWLARTYIESERYTEARELIETLEGNDQFPKELEGELAINAADLNLQQQNYDEAIQYLNIGIKKIKGNKRKTRYTYILAQLYQEIENNEKALETYHQVIRRRPNYKMLFNARINSASVYSGEGNVATLRKELNKMSKKKKNEPFLDQIYFALGNILYNEGKIDDAVIYYKKSAAFSVDNTFQRAQSCLTLADIYFEKREYIPSGNYYDSAMVVIDDNYPNFKEIEAKHGSLSKLVTNLVTVQTQDSLQYLAGLSDILLTAKIDGWIAAEEKRIETMQEAGEGDDYSGVYGRATSNRLRIGNQGGGWYFYNPSTVSYGKQEFKRIWGERKNEDNWRRKDKSISMYDEMGEPIANEFEDLIEEEDIKTDDPTQREYYVQNIPSTDSLMVISHQLIRDALYNAGNLFKTEFNDFERSIESFRELDRRYPENIYELPSFFNLWDLYNIVENTDSSTYFRSTILTKYPESNYAKYLINPNYFIEEEARKDSLNSLYNQTFVYYKNRNYNKANQYSKMVMSMNPDSVLIPKIRFIQMISGSRGFQQKQFADSLRAYIQIFPSAEPTPLANQILDLIKEEKLADYDEMINTGYLNEVIKNLELLQNDNPEDQFSSKWITDDALLHYFIIAFPNEENIDVNRLKFDIANYNIDHYTMLDFEIETENLNNNIKLIVVRNFDDKESALIYFLSIIRKQQVFKTLAEKQFINFIISNTNFREMLSDRTYDQYLPYFVKNYSIFTTGEFPDEELESPEELMAKLKKDDEDELIEKGEYVLINTENENYVAPEPKEQIFKLDYSAPHFFMIKINEVRYRTGFLMRDITRYNSSNYRSKRLRVVPNNLKESTILLVSSFSDAYEANLYLKEVNNNKDLFKSLDETEYETFIISNDNLSKLRETNDINEWNYFYRNNFIYNKPPSPQIEVPVEIEEKKIEIPVTEEEKVTAPQPDVIETKSDENLINNTEEQKPSVSEDTFQTTTTPVPENNTETVAIKDEDISYSGPFTFAPDEMHNLIYLLPNSGSNKTLLTTYLSRLNAMKFRGQNIKVSVEEFDNIRSAVIVSGIGNKEKAIEYYNIVNADSRIIMSLRNVNYQSILLTNFNLNELKQSKDINEYKEFYNIFYK